MDTVIENILITTYATPHLFWVIESRNRKRTEQISYLKKELKKLVENELSPANYSFELGQVSMHKL